jgi:AraC-like DNA-binding protein
MTVSVDPLLPGVNPLHVWSGMRMELIWIYDGRIHPINQQRETDHSQGYWVWFLQEGFVEVRQGKTVLRAEAGECMVSPRGLMRQHFSPDAHILSVHFGCEWPTGDSLFVDRTGCVFKSGDHPKLLTKAQELCDFVKAFFPVAADAHFAEQPIPHLVFLQLQRHFIEWLEAFSQTLMARGYAFTQIGSVDERLLSAVRCLKETSLDASFPAALIQKETGLGRSQLDRLFFQSFGISTRTYWNNRRLESAKALLSTTVSPIKEVGFRLGFKQASHFTTWFSDHVGLTPVAYRERERFDGATLPLA